MSGVEFDPDRLPEVDFGRALVGQKALVTGASSGIGRAVAIALGKAGADVVVNYVAGKQAADEVVAEIEATGARGLAVRADVSSEDDVRAMFRQPTPTVTKPLRSYGTASSSWCI